MSQHDGETSGDIDGFQYRVLMLDPLIAADIIADLGFILAPVAGAIGGVVVKEKGTSLGSLLDGTGAADLGESGGEDGELDDDEDMSGSNIDVAFERAVIGFFGRFSKAKQRELIDIMMKQTSVIMPDGKAPALASIFRVHFKGRIAAMYRWLGFAMKVQFKDFFTGPGGGISAALAQVTRAAASE